MAPPFMGFVIFNDDVRANLRGGFCRRFSISQL
jgi:hypothetical protein